MMRSFFSLLPILLCGVVGHAQKPSKDTVQEITLDTLTVSARGGPLVYRASEAKQWEIRHTRIALFFNWKEKTADAREWIKLHPYSYATDTLVMDAQDMRIDSVELVSKKGNTPLKYTYDRNHIKIAFGCMYKATDSIELYLKYTAMPYSDMDGGSSAIADDRGLYFINTDYSTPHKPAEIWTQGETESNSHWMVTIDKPNTRFTTQVELTVPDSFVTLSNGAMVKQLKNVKGMHTDIWKMDMPIQAYGVMFAIGKYSIIRDHWKNKEVSYYVEPEFAPYATKMFNNTAEMMGYFSQRTGVLYPWNKYSQVVARDYVSGAMENTSASLFGEFMNQNAREIADKNSEDIVSHELFHQWFGDYVTAESWSNLTLNESFANYGEQLWRGYKYGKASADELAYNDLQGYIGYARINDPQLVRFNYDSREEMFDPISYNKGGAILHYLNRLIGDAAFDKAMNIYLTRNALHSAEAHNWRMAVEEATGQDWNWFFNEWYYHAGHPVLKIVYNYNDAAKTLGVTVKQKQADSPFLYRLPLKTAILYGNSREMVDWNITKRKDTFTYAYKDGKRPVVIPDYDNVLPGELNENKKPEQYLVQFMNCDDYVNRRLAIAAAGKLLSDSVSQLIIDRGLNDGLASIRKLTLSQLKNAENDKYHKRWTAKIRNISLTDSSKIVRADALGVLGAWKVKAAEEDMFRALYDSSYILAGNALDAISKMDKDTAYILSKKLMLTNPRSTLDYVIWNVIGNKGADEDIVLYEVHAPYVQGSKKFPFATSMSSYLKNVKSDESFRRCVAIYTGFITSDNLKGYRAALGSYLFQVASEQKDNAKSDKKEEAAVAKRRLAIVKSALEKVVAAETDTETLKDYKSKMKDI
ncbi:MAG: peptidase [Flavipsychrobacter sp.]|nr:peptidase [Flavipsychrobacter sp.]